MNFNALVLKTNQIEDTLLFTQEIRNKREKLLMPQFKTVTIQLVCVLALSTSFKSSYVLIASKMRWKNERHGDSDESQGKQH